MNKMGSPWPWTQEPVKVNPAGPPVGSIIHSNNNNTHHHHHHNNKRGSLGYAPTSFFNNHLNAEIHHSQHFPIHPQHQQHQNHHPQHLQHPSPQQLYNNHNRFIPTSPPSSGIESMDQSGSGELIQRKRSQTQQQQPAYFTFEGIQPPLHHNNQYQQHYPNHHHQTSNHHSSHQSINNGNYHPMSGNLTRKFSNSSASSLSPSTGISSPAISSPITPFSSSSVNTANNGTSQHHKHQSQFVTVVKEIPSWSRYYSDQKHRLIDFTDKNNSIRVDPYINQMVSLCFDTCITNLSLDAIVNSTTEEYSGSFGVDKTIHQKAGRSLREACKSLPKILPGEAHITPGYLLPAKYVIHTNGPLAEEDRSKPLTFEAVKQLKACYENSLNLLLENELRTIAFPCISTGKKGLSKRFAAEIALSTVRRFLEKQAATRNPQVDRVIFCLNHQMDIEIYLRYMQIYFPVTESPYTITLT